MATEKSSADLLTDINSDVTSQVNPDSITPTVLGADLANIAQSAFNKVDGVTVGTNSRALSIPATFTATINPTGQTMEQVFQAIMDQVNLDHISITGGVQGLQGEFLANITAETKQTLLVDETTTARNTFRKVATIKLPNDKDGGCFDNGNNWLVDKFLTPSGGQASIKYSASGLILNVLENNMTSLTSTRTFRAQITKNGTLIGSAFSNEIDVTTGGFVGNTYFNDFNTGTIATAANDLICLELWEKSTSAALSSDTVRVQLVNGFFNNEII